MVLVKRVFVSGPILGMELDQGYRAVVAAVCMSLGFEVIDPWRREKSLYKGGELWWWPNVPAEGFVQRDLEDAERCDVMVVYLPKLSAGACMEMFYAKRKGKKVIVVSEMESLSPWIKIHADAIVKNFEELKTELKKLQ